MSRVGSRDTGHSRVKPPSEPLVVLGSDPRVEPADLACRFAIFKLTAACRRVLVVPAPRGPDPRLRPAGPKMIQHLPRLARRPLSRRPSDRTLSKRAERTRQPLVVPGIKCYATPVSDEAVGIIQV